jgi:deoxyhypusine synthase
MSIKQFMKHNFRHFNAAVCVDAAEAYIDQLKHGNKMMVTLAGAMSTAELGVTLAEMIRRDKVHAISCTGANLEEDIFNAVAHNFYERVPHYRQLSTEDEIALYDRGMNRVTDTCIPEDEAFRAIEKPLFTALAKSRQRWCELLSLRVYVSASGRSRGTQVISDPREGFMGACR